MAKKKKRNEENKKSNGYNIELTGLLFVLIAIIGFGQFGIVGELITAFATFLVGTWYNLLLIALFLVGTYMMIKREKPDFFTSKLFGIYIIAIGILIFSHTKYVELNNLKGFEIIKETVHNFLSSTQVISNVQGGGILGALFSVLFIKLFDVNGSKIVVWALLICGAIIFTGISLIDMFKIIKKALKNIIKLRKNAISKEEIAKAEKEYEKDNKIVVSSVDELIHVNDNKLEEDSKEVKIEENNPIYDSKDYIYPPITLLNRPYHLKNNENEEAVKDNIAILEQVFADFGIEGKVVAVNIGPSVTQYEMEIKAGTKISKVLSIHREIALALAAKDVRIQAPIPGKKTVGVEIPNRIISTVTVREILENVPKSYKDSKLLVVLGKDIMGRPIYCEINKTPHLLVAGATGSGKSVCINSMIISILMRTKPDEVKFLLVDPKKVELSVYNGIPHLLTPVVTDPKKANVALKKIVAEMERRYELFSETGTKNIAGYNLYIERKNKYLDEGAKLKPLPYIVVIIDELADLMLIAAKEVEDSIMRITQMARAAGIHLIVATQRPSTDVITGLIKSNIPSRISFAVSSSIDSRTILDMSGAEKLLGKGDMLFLPMGENMPIRIQGTFISEEEIKAAVNHIIEQQKAQYDETMLMDDEEIHATTMNEDLENIDEPLYNEIVEFVVTQGKASASLLQRKFRIGYNRAARAIDLLEERGIIGPANGSKPREVLVKLEGKDDKDSE
ncbi:MAG: DNA translocase FtsK [Mollicutes bacterium]|nr:DNA translocase FtsK [Mollicutes bacterium]